MKKRMKQNELLRQLLFEEVSEEDMERGQLLLILAASMIALLVAAGLAIDGGMLFVRRAQLARAIDSAALSGVVIMHENLASPTAVDFANDRAEQVMALNGVPIIDNAGTDGDPLESDCWPVNDSQWDSFDMCGTQNPGSVPGAVRYMVRVQWESPVFFMRIIGFEDVPLYASAEAEYYPVVDIFANTTTTTGTIRTAVQSISGPDFRPSIGDAFTAWPGGRQGGGSQPLEAWREIEGVYTYRIQIPEQYMAKYASQPGGAEVRVEILDPDIFNCSGGACANDVYRRDGTRQGNACGGATCVTATGEDATANPWWFGRLDDVKNEDTPLGFRLYYFQEQSDGSLTQIDLAYYTSGTTGETDMTWVSPTDVAAERRENPVLMLGGPSEVWLINETDGTTTYPGVGTYEWYELEDGLLCTDDAEGDGFGGSGTDIERACFWADTNGDGNLTYNAGDDAEPAISPDTCDGKGDDAIWPAGDGPASSVLFNPEAEDGNYDPAEQCPGNHDFIVSVSGDTDSETPGIFVDPASGVRFLYLDVMGIAGTSENGYELWAGPPSDVFEAPPQANGRNMWNVNGRQYGDVSPNIDDPTDLGDIQIFALGYIPMNALQGERVETFLTSISGVFEGSELTVEVYDQDGGADGPMYLYFDELPKEDFLACWGANVAECQNTANTTYGLTDYSGIIYGGQDGIPNGGDWNAFSFTIPDDENVGFYGGSLVMSYENGNVDSFTIKITIDSRPYLTQ